MNRYAVIVGAALLATGLAAAVPAAADQPFASSVFLATHNSYSGNVDGAKNSITYQLDHGVRFIELDIHDNGYATNHDYSIGHGSPGDLVDHAGNPASNLLRDWLSVISTWSAGHPTAAPVVVMLDIKDNLTDNQSFADGNLAALNQELRTAFGGKLLRPADYAGQSVDALRGRIMPLLSGDGGTRTAYRADNGFNPAVALNGNGQIVEVHDSGAGALWYWTGTYGSDGRVTWLRHGKYDSGVTPAVALNDSGQLVEVHQSQNATTLWYHVGRLGADGEITWSPSHQYDNGVLPTLTFTGSSTLREIHRSQNNSQNWTWNGTLNASAGTVTWTGNAKTSDPRFDKSFASRGSASVRVFTGADGAAPTQTLLYATDRIARDRIRYQQTAFDEFQDGDSAQLQEGALFYGAPATHKSFITSARQSGHPVRGWDFDSADLATIPLANYPATNHPWDSWYQNLLSQAGAVR
jgi:hypothetical protein